ncbi:Isocyanide synthase-NRPS hybrid crmA [Penicillium atrosanguineum]|uniref:Isocyanide synthase-NRPS hybrid crmA n=1 Tax=Penicillium atrosanguineum TaxID=1132637 RepID=A0A9W9U3A2_9EURO|nr:Isocyanide synthase-NRPS hybrid crmA [Penicillium atrosanguineum]KAJ5307416.1 Isocyanide synthase-NRPS hybrid crmA [Penicillium atrosanguineum]
MASLHSDSDRLESKSNFLTAEILDTPAINSAQYSSDVELMSQRILDVFLKYALNKFGYAPDHLDGNGEGFLSVIARFVAEGARVQACLPVFPFKSANKVYKVLGSLPDKAEELALDRLNTLCNYIQDFYAPGAEIVIISDGITYNDKETWEYGESLRSMAIKKGFRNISFSRIRDLLDISLPNNLTEIVYVANCSNFRRLLLNQYGKANLDIDEEITKNADTKLTYLGYKRYTTPWHCSVAQLADGVWVSAPMGEFSQDTRLELVHVQGTPSHYREKLSGGGHNPISETTASYLQSVKPIKATAYVNNAFKDASSFASSSNEDSVSSSEGKYADSRFTILDTLATSEFLSPLFGLGIEISSKPGVVPSPLETKAGVSTEYGRRLIPQIINELAASEPERTVFSLASLSNGFLKLNPISAQRFTRAVDKTAWWLRDQVGTPDLLQPMAYIGPRSFPIPKNNADGILAVLNKLDCNIWVNAIDASPVPVVKDVLQERPMKYLQLPTLDLLLDAESTEAFPYTKTFDEAINDPFSRLMPPIGENADLAPWTSDWNEGDKIYSSFPMSHGAGIIMDILMPALFNLHCILGPVGVLPNLNLVGRLAVDVKIDIWSMVPSLVDELGEASEILEHLHPSKFICASGGPVSPANAGKVNEIVRVLNLTGTTEGLFIGNLKPAREDWFWFCFHPYSGFEFKELETDTYEHWVHRNEQWALFQGIFHTFPDRNSINFKDLYMQHPTKPNLRAFKGRSDDPVVLSNGYKISPLETEAFITTHPDISGCLIFGTGKPQAGLLIELNDPSNKLPELIDRIWRFYSSRNDDVNQVVTFDMSSVGAIEDSIRMALRSSLSEAQSVLREKDIFSVGLDSLGVFAAVKTIRVVTGLGDKISPRHFYANPTIMSLSTTISTLFTDAKNAESEGMNDLIAQHKARQSFRLDAFDYVNPNHGMGIMLYFSIHEEIPYKQVFQNLQQGLNRTFDMIPALSGKMMYCSEQEIGYKKEIFDLSDVLPPFEKLKEAGFPPSAVLDSLVLREDPFPKFPADIFSGQVSFISGGCIVALDLNHCCLDGLGVMVVLKAWAENCRYLQGDQGATCSWFHLESFNHALPEIIHEKEGWARPVKEIDPGIWGFLPFFPPDQYQESVEETTIVYENNKLPPALDFKLHDIWPLPRAERCTETTMFLIRPESLEKMKQEVISDPESKGMPIETLCSDHTTIGRVAYLLRESAARITPSFIHDTLSILQSLPNHERFSTANMGLEHMHAMISNMMLFPANEVCFGDAFFANGGCPISLRPQVERGNGRFRFLVILPIRKDGGIELVFGTYPEELKMFLADKEFTKYAELLALF